MASKTCSSIALFLMLNLLFFALVSAQGISPTPSSSTSATCPLNAIKLGLCITVLDTVNITVGNPPVTPCCNVIRGLLDLEAAACLCTAIKASVLGISLNLPLQLSVLLNACKRSAPSGFQCPN